MSKSAIGYALTDSPKVSQTTREYVQRKARELGYQPNPVASAFLRQVRARQPSGRANLAMLIAAKADWVNISSLPAGALERSRELGYTLDVIRTGDYAPKRLTSVLLARGVLGVIFSPLHEGGDVALDWSKFASASYGYTILNPKLHRVVHNHMEGIRTAVRMLKAKGHRRIGLVLSHESDARSNHLWSCGFLGINAGLPAARRVSPLLDGAARLTTGCIRSWRAREKPDAVIFHLEQNIPPLPEFAPRKIPCVVLDRWSNNAVDGIDQQFKRGGRMLVDLVSSQILHNERGIPSAPITSMVQGTWVG